MSDLPYGTIDVDGLVFSARTGTSAGLIDVTRALDGRAIDQFQVSCAAADADGLRVEAQRWVAQRRGAVPPPPVHCRVCGDEIVPVMNRDTDYQFDNALWVTFSGGYSMFIDAEDCDRVKVVICHGCAHQLCEQVPWIAELLDLERSHAHLSNQHDELIAAGHHGWGLQR